MFLNTFAGGLDALDMTGTDEFASLCRSAGELGIAHSPDVAYRSRQTVLRGHRFHFTEWGRAGLPQVLLLHGGNQSSHSWDLVSLHLADRFHVFALDQRGHGDSEWNREIDYSMDAMADDVAAFIDQQGLTAPVVFGHSMGGRITLTLALARPGIAKAYGIVDVGPEVSEKGAKVIQNFVLNNVEFDDLDVFVTNVQKYDPYRTRAHIERTVKYNMLRRSDGKYVSKVDHRRMPNINAELTLDMVATINEPVLVVRGSDSDILEPEAAERFVRALVDGELVTVPGAGHNVHSANTLGFLEAANAFFARVHRS